MKPASFLLPSLVLTACASSPEPASAPKGPLASRVEQLAIAYDVPADLVFAIASVEGGLMLPARRDPDPDQTVPVAGILELRHGAFDSLAEGAKLVGRSELELRADTDLGTQAGIAVLAQLGSAAHASPEDLASWRDALAQLSGLRGEHLRGDYVARVYRVLFRGGQLPARDGEVITVPPHLDLPPALFMPPPSLRTNATPDFPGAMWVDTPSDNKWTPGRPDGNAAVDTVVIHDTEGGWDASLATLQNDGGKSAHYLVDADGSRVAQFVSEYDTAWHAGNWFYNKHSVGIEHVGFVSDPNGYATPLYAKSVELVSSIRSRWAVPLDRAHIIGHYQVPNGTNIAESSPPCSNGLDPCETDLDYGGASHHTDPGYHWQWCQYMEMLGGSCACNDAWSLWNCTNDGTEVWRCKSGTLEKQDCESCDVMPVGTEDVCHPATAPEPQPEASTEQDAELEASAEASVPDASWPEVEAGTDAGADSAASASTAVAQGEPSGCACSAGRSRPSGKMWGSLALASLAMLLRRRRQARSAR